MKKLLLIAIAFALIFTACNAIASKNNQYYWQRTSDGQLLCRKRGTGLFQLHVFCR